MSKLDDILKTYYTKKQFASSRDDTDYTVKHKEQIKTMLLDLVRTSKSKRDLIKKVAEL